MSWKYKSIFISEEVAGATTVAETYIPSVSVHEIEIRHFKASAAFSQNSVVKLVWRYGDHDEWVIWPIKGIDDFEEYCCITDIDGSRKLAIVLENGDDGPLVLAGHLDYLERT